MKNIVVAVLAASLVGLLSLVSLAMAETAWIDDIANSLAFSKTNYRDALTRGDQRVVKAEMGKWFKMLRVRDHGISDVAADELFNFSLMVTPIQEYGIAVPAPAGG
jgi:hypothetical protein